MKALSLIQPWAWVVVHGGKRIENRVWNTEYRGPFLIHASAQTSRSYYAGVLQWCQSRLGVNAAFLPPYHQLQLGGIIGKAEIVGVLPPEEFPTATWHMPNQYGFVLQHVKPLPFQPCKGHQRWWTFPDHLLTPGVFA